MEEWGQVESFELRLRRREALRADGEGAQAPATGRTTNERRRPVAIPATVPGWLLTEAGTEKTFDDVRQVVERIRAYLTQVRQDEASKVDTKEARNIACRNSSVRFPDIEFLPTFRPQFVEAARRRASQKKQGRDGA